MIVWVKNVAVTVPASLDSITSVHFKLYVFELLLTGSGSTR